LLNVKSNPEKHPQLKQKILVELLKSDLQGNNATNFSYLVTSGLFFAFFNQADPGYGLELWLAFTIIVSALRLALNHYLKTIADRSDWLKRSIWLNCSVASLYSLSWVAMFALCFDANANSAYLLISLSLAMIMATVVNSSNFVPFFHIICLPTTVIMAAMLISDDNPQLRLIGLVVPVCYGYSWSLILKFNRDIRSAIILRFEKDQLLDELEQKRHQAEKSSSDKSRFLAEAIHDLRQPLHVLGLFFDTIKLRATTPEPLHAKVDASIEHLEQLFDSLLDISKLDADAISVNPSSFYSQVLLQELRDEHLPNCSGKQLQLHMSSEIEVLHTDRQLLKRILGNLLSNAVRYTDTGQVKLNIESNDQDDGTNWARVTVSDTGVGIPLPKQSMVFDAFYQIDNQRQQGLGLGLAIVKRLSQLLMLDLQLDSEPGRGTRFQFAIPCGEATDIKVAAIIQASPADHQADILVLDDDANILDAMELTLKHWGYRAIPASSIKQAISEITNPANSVELIISDYTLRSGSNGIDAITKLRQASQINLPALLVSGDTTAEILNLAEQQKLLLLHKPLRPTELRQHILKLLHPSPAKVGT